MTKTVLVVEDDVGVRRALARLLGEWGWRTIEAGNGREAVQWLAEETPAAIVIDLLMPIMSGAELLKALRRNSFYRTIPTVVMTGALDPDAEEIFGVPVVVKPNIERLPELLERLVAEAPPATASKSKIVEGMRGALGNLGSVG